MSEPHDITECWAAEPPRSRCAHYEHQHIEDNLSLAVLAETSQWQLERSAGSVYVGILLAAQASPEWARAVATAYIDSLGTDEPTEWARRVIARCPVSVVAEAVAS